MQTKTSVILSAAKDLLFLGVCFRKQSFRASRVSLLLTFAPSLGLTLAMRGRYAVQIVPDDLSAKVTTALQEQREQRSWPEGRRAGCPESNICAGVADAMKPHPEAAIRSFDLRSSAKAGRLELAHPCAQTCEPCSRFRLRCSASFMAQTAESKAKMQKAD